MSDVKVHVHTQAGVHIGYFLNPKVAEFPGGDYEISGMFYNENGQPAGKQPFNPEALPYQADLSALAGHAHKKLVNVYVQRGRQPVLMTGQGA